MSELVLVTQAEGICEVRLNRPEKRNAISFPMYQQLTRALTEAQSEEQVRAVLLSGAGACFSAGNDLQDFLGGPSFGAEHPAMQFLRALATFGKPLLAAVHGQTVGIGVTLLLHCDLIVAARNTQLTLPFVPLGLVPEAGSSLLLPRRIGYQRAAELLFLGQPCNADTAYRLGLVNSVVEDEALPAEARALARAVAQQPAAALAATRRLLRAEDREVLARIEEEARIFGVQLQSEEFRARVRALLTRARSGG
jgi:enoyl-CoA hydratase/carnithine racemase